SSVERSPVAPAAKHRRAGSKLTIQALAGGFGAELTPMDLRRTCSDAARKQIHAAFVAHSVLVFRRQQLTKEAMADFAGMFGEVEGNVFRKPDGATMEAVHQISNLDADGQPAENPYLKSNYFWHSDK